MGEFPRGEGDGEGHPSGRWEVQDQEWWCEGGKGGVQSPSGKRKRNSEGGPGEEQGQLDGGGGSKFSRKNTKRSLGRNRGTGRDGVGISGNGGSWC